MGGAGGGGEGGWRRGGGVRGGRVGGAGGGGRVEGGNKTLRQKCSQICCFRIEEIDIRDTFFYNARCRLTGWTIPAASAGGSSCSLQSNRDNNGNRSTRSLPTSLVNEAATLFSSANDIAGGSCKKGIGTTA